MPIVWQVTINRLILVLLSTAVGIWLLVTFTPLSFESTQASQRQIKDVRIPELAELTVTVPNANVFDPNRRAWVLQVSVPETVAGTGNVNGFISIEGSAAAFGEGEVTALGEQGSLGTLREVGDGAVVFEGTRGKANRFDLKRKQDEKLRELQIEIN